MFLGLPEAGLGGSPSDGSLIPRSHMKRCGHSVKNGEYVGKPVCRPRSGVQGFDSWAQRQLLNQPTKFSVG